VFRTEKMHFIVYFIKQTMKIITTVLINNKFKLYLIVYRYINIIYVVSLKISIYLIVSVALGSGPYSASKRSEKQREK
jgi:hypothetical protein